MHKISKKFLLIFSLGLFSAGGIVWACAGGEWDESEYSNFAPEAFVDLQYSPFFYTSWQSYYGTDVNDNSNTRYNTSIVQEWKSYLDYRVSEKDLNTLLFSASYKGIDSAYQYFKGKLTSLPANLQDLKTSGLKRKQVDPFFTYLLLAKQCEQFAVSELTYYWDEKVPVVIPEPAIKISLVKGFKKNRDPFIKQRYWFQLIRYAYFDELPALNADSSAGPDNSGLVSLFKQYENSFPKNSIYYRALGYLAGHYYKRQDYAQANYLYSLCFNFSSEMKIPSKWSFHPQDERDWVGSLAMAKNKEEKITLWQMMGIVHDENRAIENIYKLDPKSDKLDLLLSRLINRIEVPNHESYLDSAQQIKVTIEDIALVDRIAVNADTRKPYYWNLVAGYLHSLNGDFANARKFYDQVKVQLPKNDRLVEAQYRLLDWTLYLSRLRKIDSKAETEMVDALNWLADLRDQKDTVTNLRYQRALNESINGLANRYKKQGDLLKSNCFQSSTAFYAKNENIEALKSLLGKKSKSPFERAMLRYYPFDLGDLYYHQGLMQVYQEKTDAAIALFEKSDGKASYELLANPFNSRINDCHDCDFAAVQAKKYTAVSLLQTIKAIKGEIAAGKNLYTNNYLLGNVYYNITHYGNARDFYQTEITGSDATSAMDIPKEFRRPFTSGKIAEKYYLQARAAASTSTQKARCTFMAAKCERNDIYNLTYNDQANEKKYYWDFNFETIPFGKYFAELHTQYSNTPYYKEILKECGYFKSYVDKH
jgi:hypothetical protein